MDTPLRSASVRPSTDQVWQWLSVLTDPEIPVVTLKEMGILRDVQVQDDHIAVTITPTYSGCPAISQIEDDVRTTLAQHGVNARVVTQLSPAWTTDWMSESGKEKLRQYGIAPPRRLVQGKADESVQGALSVVHFISRTPTADVVPCPLCASSHTVETSHFASTACKALYKCLDCLEPFDYFKPY